MTSEPDTPEISLHEVGQRARSAIGWRFLGQGINTSLQTAASIVLARLLMPKDFGIVAMALMVTGLAVLFYDLGFGQALIQRSEITEEHRRSAFWATLVMALTLCGLLVWGAPYVGVYFREPRMVPVVRLISLTFLLLPFTVVPRALVTRRLDFRTLFFAGVLSNLLYGITAIIMALIGYGYWSLVGGAVAGGLAGVLGMCLLTGYLPPLRPSFRGVRDLWGFGVGVTGIGLFAYLGDRLDYFVIGRCLDTTKLGLYERAYKLMEFPLTVVGQLLGGALFPAFSRIQDDQIRLRRAFENIITLVASITWPFFGVLLVVAPEFVPIVFGAQWKGAIIPLQILVLAGFARVLLSVIGVTTKSMGSQYVWGGAWRLGVYGLLVGLGAWGAARWGIRGVAWAVVGANAAYLALSVHLLYQAIGFTLGDWAQVIVTPLALAGVVGGMAWGVRLILVAVGAEPWQSLVASSVSGVATLVAAVAFIPSRQLELVRNEIIATKERLMPIRNS
ncbi:MAG: lipopolysaccharide biosynthesis protein [Candidatus Zipacnadales bacterium]